jgi:hypothetical protein
MKIGSVVVEFRQTYIVGEFFQMSFPVSGMLLISVCFPATE